MNCSSMLSYIIALPHTSQILLLSDTFSAFAVDPISGVITTTVEINYEDATFYTLLVRAYDSNGGAGAKSSTAVVTVMVSTTPVVSVYTCQVRVCFVYSNNKF